LAARIRALCAFNDLALGGATHLACWHYDRMLIGERSRAGQIRGYAVESGREDNFGTLVTDEDVRR
jgi:hypothetical protein